MCDVFIVIYDSIISFFYLGSDEKGNHKKALTKRIDSGHQNEVRSLIKNLQNRKKVKRSIERALQ